MSEIIIPGYEALVENEVYVGNGTEKIEGKEHKRLLRITRLKDATVDEVLSLVREEAIKLADGYPASYRGVSQVLDRLPRQCLDSIASGDKHALKLLESFYLERRNQPGRNYLAIQGGSFNAKNLIGTIEHATKTENPQSIYELFTLPKIPDRIEYSLEINDNWTLPSRRRIAYLLRNEVMVSRPLCVIGEVRDYETVKKEITAVMNSVNSRELLESLVDDSSICLGEKARETVQRVVNAIEDEAIGRDITQTPVN